MYNLICNDVFQNSKFKLRAFRLIKTTLRFVAVFVLQVRRVLKSTIEGEQRAAFLARVNKTADSLVRVDGAFSIER